jgi:hypothetical protein
MPEDHEASSPLLVISNEHCRVSRIREISAVYPSHIYTKLLFLKIGKSRDTCKIRIGPYPGVRTSVSVSVLLIATCFVL